MLIRISRPTDDLLLGLWRIPIPSAYGQKRGLEKQAERELLAAMLGREVELRHNADGAPLIDGRHVSISHTRGFLAILLSERGRVGVDIEYRSDRIRKIASRFLRPDEQPATLDEMLVHWCAKEAVYKLRSAEHLAYEQMRIRPAQSQADDFVKGDAIPFSTEITPDYVLVWAYEPYFLSDF